MNKEIIQEFPDKIQGLILIIRGHSVILDSDLARLYEVETKTLNRAVQRNKNRFPNDFMFKLTIKELENLRYQNGTSSGYGGRRYLPHVFTEEGVAMLSSVLRSQRAVEVNIVIMRAFVQMRRMIDGNRELAARIDDLEKKYSGHDENIQMIFAAIRELMNPLETSRRPIGFGENAQ
jgi:hypothetical protein